MTHNCGGCGVPVEYQGRGKPREYCSQTCKRAAKAARISGRRAEAATQRRTIWLAEKADRVAATREHLCRKCQRVLPVELFVKSARHANGVANWCRDCYREYNASRKARTLELSRQGRFGLTPEQQRELMAAQDFRCASCNVPFENIQHETPHLDHCHATGRVRGFLCRACNHAIGSSLEDPLRLEQCAVYIRKHQLVTT